MRKTPLPDTAARAIAPANARLLAAFAENLAGRAEHTRTAYLRDTAALAGIAQTSLAQLSSRELDAVSLR